MIYLTGVSNDTIREAAATLPWLGLMAQPRSAVLDHVPDYLPGYAADNGAFGAWIRQQPFDAAPWLRMLDRLPGSPLFVVVPDVVGDHAASLTSWDLWAPEVIARQYRPAFVLQNGCTDLGQVPPEADVVFIGGDDAYKLGPDAARVCWQARNAGLWVHMGRVNSSRRIRRAVSMGCDSADGTFLRFGPPAYQLDRLARWMHDARELGGQLDLTETA